MDKKESFAELYGYFGSNLPPSAMLAHSHFLSVEIFIYNLTLGLQDFGKNCLYNRNYINLSDY